MTVVSYGSQPGMGRASRVWVSYAVGFAFSLLGVGGVWGMLVFWVSKCFETFKDFKTSLPSFTELVLRVAFWASDPVGLAVGLLLMLVLPVLPAIFVGWSEERKE